MIKRKSRHEIAVMKKAGEIVAKVHLEMQSAVKPGISTSDLDKIAEQVIRDNGGIPSFKGYRGFPCSICASVNEQVVHGIPSDRIIKEGDIISVDVGAMVKGMHGDSARTYPVGEISDELKNLLDCTEKGLFSALSKIKSGVNLLEVSAEVEDKAREFNLGLVTQYGGHGIGHNLHEEPFIFNMRIPKSQPKLEKGMTIAIEPMYNLGSGDVHSLEDGWTVVTNDGKHSAHFEHTVLVTEDGYEILTTIN